MRRAAHSRIDNDKTTTYYYYTSSDELQARQSVHYTLSVAWASVNVCEAMSESYTAGNDVVYGVLVHQSFYCTVAVNTFVTLQNIIRVT